MKSEFYLRSTAVIDIMPAKIYLLMAGIATVVTICTRNWAAVLLFLLPCLGLLLLMWISDKMIRKNGLYIKGNRVYIKRVFSKKDILPQEIAGIKIMQMYKSSSGSSGSDTPQYYENGAPIYLIILLSEIEPGMYNFKQNECLFEVCFDEEIIYEAEFNPEAVNYLKTLNPDIKVFY